MTDLAARKYLLYGNRLPIPSLDLSFLSPVAASGLVLDPRITWTRATTGPATSWDATGTLQTARNNVITNSQAIGSWLTQTDVTITANSTTSPDGTVNASLVTEGVAGSGFIGSALGTVAANSTVSFSVYVKRGNTDWLRMVFGDTAAATNGMTVWANVNTGALGTVSIRGTATAPSGAIQAIGNGWYRVTGTVTLPVASVAATVAAASASADNVTTRVNNATYYVWGGQAEVAPNVGAYIPTGAAANGAPRLDYDPNSGRTNWIRNSTMVGASAGTPGTMPTNWTVGATGGLTRSVVGTGTEDGIAYLDVRFNGTVSSGEIAILPEAFGQVPALQNQTWTASVYYRLVAGSFTNAAQSGMVQVQSGNAALGTLTTYSVAAAPFPTASPSLSNQRYSATALITDATTVWVRPRLQISTPNNGTTVDFTLRIGAPQIEVGGAPTPFIATSSGIAHADCTLRGLLVEETRTNLWLQSADASNAAWTKGANPTGPVVTANQTIAPDGTLTAAQVVLATCTAAQYCQLNQGITATAAVYTQSVWMRGAVGGEVLYLMTSTNAVNWWSQQCTLTTAWQRFTFVSPTLTAASWFFQIGFDRRDAAQTTTTGCTFFVWGGQVELGAFATTYIPTGAASATRPAESANMASLGSWFNPNAGTLRIDWDTERLSTAAGVWGGFSAGSFANTAYFSASGYNVIIATVGATANSGVTQPSGAINKSIGSYGAPAGVQCSNNGSAAVANATYTNANAPYPWTNLAFGSSPWSVSGNQVNGHIRASRYWPQALTPLQMQRQAA